MGAKLSSKTAAIIRLATENGVNVDNVSGRHHRTPSRTARDTSALQANSLPASMDGNESPPSRIAGRRSLLSNIGRGRGARGIPVRRDGEPVQGSIDRGNGRDVAGAALLEPPDGCPADPSLAGDTPARQIAGDEPLPSDSDAFTKGSGLLHERDHNAQEVEQSSAQKSGHAPLRLVAQNALMKLSTADIMRRLKEHTGWSWRSIADHLGVSPNTPQNWESGGSARDDNLRSACLKLKLTPGQFMGLEEIPDNFLGHIDITKPPRPSRRGGERLYTQSEVDAMIKAALAKRGTR